MTSKAQAVLGRTGTRRSAQDWLRGPVYGKYMAMPSAIIKEAIVVARVQMRLKHECTNWLTKLTPICDRGYRPQ
jgi:hypothetical protein